MALLLVFFLLPSMAPAQSAVNVRSLFQDRSFVPLTLIPFQVKGSLVSGGARLSEVVITSQSAVTDCRVMLDPFHNDVFLVKCQGETDLQLRVSLVQNGVLYPVNYGPIAIRNPAPNLVAVDPGTNSADWTAGKALFSRCISCHQATRLKGRTAAQIYTATFSPSNPGYSNMNKNADIKSLTDAQRKQIEIYLANPAGVP